ncbi:hypothetical protein AOZ06_32425 [Kibdelosporangium phytohabitans]|uniref:Uncharacterized protein n=1 Tax=Kibdelosporangium phytohabitans TaxID=860235 RepID=A0A0N9I7S9_9PSEU|nr:hypothetical protein AOZ06_32425 [Kibdelosporangium phytohabitans]
MPSRRGDRVATADVEHLDTTFGVRTGHAQRACRATVRLGSRVVVGERRDTGLAVLFQFDSAERTPRPTRTRTWRRSRRLVWTSVDAVAVTVTASTVHEPKYVTVAPAFEVGDGVAVACHVLLPGGGPRCDGLRCDGLGADANGPLGSCVRPAGLTGSRKATCSTFSPTPSRSRKART